MLRNHFCSSHSGSCGVIELTASFACCGIKIVRIKETEEVQKGNSKRHEELVLFNHERFTCYVAWKHVRVDMVKFTRPHTET